MGGREEQRGGPPERDERVQWCCRCWVLLLVLRSGSGTLALAACPFWLSAASAPGRALDQPEPKGRVPAHGPISDAAPLASQARQELEEEDGDLRGERVNDRRGTGEGGGRCFFSIAIALTRTQLGLAGLSVTTSHGSDGVACLPCR